MVIHILMFFLYVFLMEITIRDIEEEEAIQMQRDSITYYMNVMKKGITLENYNRIYRGMEFQDVYDLLAADTAKVSENINKEVYFFSKDCVMVKINFINKKVDEKVKIGF